MRASAVALVLAALCGACHGLEHAEVLRVIDCTSSVVRVRHDLKVVQSDGRYDFVVPREQSERLAYVMAKNLAGGGEELAVEKVSDGDGGAVFRVAIAKGKAHFRVRAVYTRRLEPFPAEIAQREEQLVVLRDSHYFYTPYATRSQTLSVKTGSGRVEDFADLAPSVRKPDSIAVGPYADVPARSWSPLRVHYANHAPFAHFTNAHREIEVSHWGNINVEDHFDLLHTGAALKGGFSRIEYQLSGNDRGGPSFKEFTGKLPAEAHRIYYRDRIGNISTSQVRHGQSSLQLEIQTRYPMFGGWKANWYQGYNIPTSAGLAVAADGAYALTMDFGLPYEKVPCDHLEVKVVLPEGAYDVDVAVPFEVSVSRDRRYTFVDTQLHGGRPVLILEKDNVVKDHNVPFTVTYRLRKDAMYRDVLLLIGAFLGVYLFVMAALRVDLSLSSPKERPAKSKAE